MRPVNPSDLDKLQGLKVTLAADLPSFSVTNSVIVNLASTPGSQANVNQVSGILMQEFQANGRPMWSLQVEGNAAIVNCHKYDRWHEVKPKAQRILQAVLEIVCNEDNRVSTVAVEVVDKFTASDNGYQMASTFNLDAPYLTKRAIDAQAVWHIHQGWIEPADDHRVLNILNMGSGQVDDTINISIHNAVQWQFLTPVSPRSGLDPDTINNIFDHLHARNKSVISELLAKEQLIAIGMIES